MGRTPAKQCDSFGETFGSISGPCADSSPCQRKGSSYIGTFITSPGRGHNIAGTIDCTPRLNTLSVPSRPHPGRPAAWRKTRAARASAPTGARCLWRCRSAAQQDGATTSPAKRDHTRSFTCDTHAPENITLKGEHVVKLPRSICASAAAEDRKLGQTTGHLNRVGMTGPA